MSTQSSFAADKARFIDIGANMLDPMFQGQYRGKSVHDSDLEDVLHRATESGVERIIVTATTLTEAQQALEWVNSHDTMYTTVGVHPTQCDDFDEYKDGPDAMYEQLLHIAKQGKESGKIVAIGECGLDYDRTKFCQPHIQQKYFERQFDLAEATSLPMFLHDRNTQGDFASMIRANRDRFSTGVVHSFTGSLEEAKDYLDQGLYIGINGCSLKTEENLNVAKSIPLDRLLIETDAPWCEIRPSHASSKYVKSTWPANKKERFKPGQCIKSRCEPCYIRQVAEVLCEIRGEEWGEFCDTVYENTCKLFFQQEA